MRYDPLIWVVRRQRVNIRHVRSAPNALREFRVVRRSASGKAVLFVIVGHKITFTCLRNSRGRCGGVDAQFHVFFTSALYVCVEPKPRLNNANRFAVVLSLSFNSLDPTCSKGCTFEDRAVET